MGSDLNEGVKIGIGLVIIIFVVTVVLGLLMLVKNLTNSSASQLEGGLNQILNTTYDDYDQQIVSGTKVTSAVKLFQGESIGIVIVTGLCQESTNAKGGYCYGLVIDGYDENGDATNQSYVASSIGGTSSPLTRDSSGTYWIGAPGKTFNLNTKPMTVSGSAQYVRDNGKYLAELIKDTTGTIIGICFTQQNAG